MEVIVECSDSMRGTTNVYGIPIKELVRCKDCKHSYEDLDSRVCAYGRCLNCDVSDDWFCADGERRSND